MVDSDVAPLLTVGKEKIEDILVLHLEGGKDFFVSLSCYTVNVPSLKSGMRLCKEMRKINLMLKYLKRK